MKERTKKILAGIGMGAVLGTSGLFMTGCTLTGADTSKMMQIAENADTFMSEMNDNMEANNQNLLDIIEEMNNNNDNMQKIIEEMNKNNDKKNKDDLALLYNYAVNRLCVNKDDVLDNFAFEFSTEVDGDTTSEEYNQSGECHWFRLSDGTRVLMRLFNGEISYYIDSIPEESDDSGDGVQTISLSFGTISNNAIAGCVPILTLNPDTIISYEILENGNYLITASGDLTQVEDYSISGIMEVELTSDGLLIGYELYLNCVDAEVEDFASTGVVISVKYKYNELTEEEVKENIEKYEESI